MNRRSPYVAEVESLIARGILSPAARDVAFDDLIFQLEQAGPGWAVQGLREAWEQAGADYSSGFPMSTIEATRDYREGLELHE